VIDDPLSRERIIVESTGCSCGASMIDDSLSRQHGIVEATVGAVEQA
jgi:hypothetical protein